MLRMTPFGLAIVALLASGPAAAWQDDPSPSAVQVGFERAAPRVGPWVQSILGLDTPIECSVSVLDSASFLDRTRTADLDGTRGAVVVLETREILIEGAMFAAHAEVVKHAGGFDEDAMSLVLAREMTRLAQSDRRGATEPDPSPEDERTRVRAVIEAAHGWLVQHLIARSLGGETLEKASRSMFAAIETVSAENKTIGEALRFLERAHAKGGMEAVWAVADQPPATMAEIAASGNIAAAELTELAVALREHLPESEWAEISRSGIETAVGQGWRWLPADTRDTVSKALDKATTLVLVDRTARVPRAITISALVFKGLDDATACPDRLKNAIDLALTRFDYLPDGTKRDSVPQPHDNLPHWKVTQGEHFLPGEKVAFGFYAHRVKGNAFIMVNGIAAPADAAGVDQILKAIDAWGGG